MAEQQFCSIIAQVKESTLVLSSRDPNLTQGSDGTWTFQIKKGTPAEVVFRLDVIDGGNGWVVTSTQRVEGDKWSAPVEWKRDVAYASPTFLHGNDFRLEIARSRSSTSTARGGGFFQVREEGGGDPF